MQLRLLERFGRVWDTSGVRKPLCDDFLAYLVRRRPSAPGPDGMPYPVMCFPAMECAIMEAARVCYEGILPLWDMSMSSLATPPKWYKPENAPEVIRAPDETRPLNRRNCDINHFRYDLAPYESYLVGAGSSVSKGFR